MEKDLYLKGMFQPAFFARVISSLLAIAVATNFMCQTNGDNKDQRSDDTCKTCWLKCTLQEPDTCRSNSTNDGFAHEAN